ncbi:MAG TPA: TonB-dependent receptor [Blastocatellia bacterium]|nr:TonB-dependent receptor [Blastocatellia bacterium]
MRYNLRHLLLSVAAVALVALTAFAQNPTGSIRGTVTDEQGAVVPKAVVTITNKATGDVRILTSSDGGTYSAENLLPGQYDIKVEATGFSTVVKTVTVQVGNASPGDIGLRVGGKNEVVDVVSEAPLIDKTDYKIDGVVNRQTIDDLPLNGRNFLQLALLEPGVSVTAKNPGSQNNLFQVSVGGADSALTRLTVDGGSILDPVCGGAAQNFSTETIQEFQMSTFNFDLSTGVTSVGAVNIISRTGTNEFHGNGFMYFRDHSIAAVPTLVQTGTSPFFRRYQYGGAVGGPIKKDRAWFFANVERLDQTSAIGTNVVCNPCLPSVTQAFSQFDTTTSSPYKGILANGRLDVKINDKENVFGRYSHDNNQVFAPDTDNSLPSNWRDNSSNDDDFQVGLTSILRNTLVNDFRFNFQRIINNENVPTSAECPSSNIGCLNLGGPEIRVLNSNFRAGNSVNAFQARDLHRYQFTDNLSWQKSTHRVKFGGEWEHNYGTGHWAFANPAVLVLFNPTQALGVDQLIALNPQIPAAIKPLLTIPVAPGFLTGGGLSLSDILGLPIVTAVAGLGDPAQPPPFQTDVARQSNRYRLYIQDAWQIKSSFTLIYGLSYTDETNLENYDLAKPALIQPIVGAIGKPNKDHTDFAPSLGFAWDVAGKGKTVVRGGAGLYYDTVLFVTRLQERATIGPAGNGRSQLAGAYFQNNLSFPQLPLPSPLNLINPAIGASINFTTIPTKFTGQNFMNLLNTESPLLLAGLQAAGAAGFSGIDFFKTGTGILDPNLQVPYSLQYSFGVEHQLPHNLALSADFVLRKQVHQLIQTDENFNNRVPALGGSVIPGCQGANAINPAAKCSNGPINVVQSSARSTYKALLVKIDKRLANDRFEFTGSYALSSLRGYTFTDSGGTGRPVSLENWFGNQFDSDADSRHRFTFSGVVNIPRGFQASIIATVATAPPYSALLPSNIDLVGDGGFGGPIPGVPVNSINRGTSFATLQSMVSQFNTQFAGKPDAHGSIIPALVLPNSVRFGKTFQSEDMRLTKTFSMKERAKIQLFAECFNVFNIANLSFQKSAEQIGPGYGQPTGRDGQAFGTGGPRAFQFGARFSF